MRKARDTETAQRAIQNRQQQRDSTAEKTGIARPGQRARSAIKGAVVQAALHGLVPYAVADFLIQRGGLRND